MQLSITRNKLVLICCCLYFILVTFYYHIDKHLTGVIFIVLTLLIPVTFSAIIIHTVDSLVKFSRTKQKFSLASCTAVTICCFTIAYTLFSPYRLNSENLESKVELRACYEGTQNQAILKLRADKSFELNCTGVFFADDWYLGQWTRKGALIFLKYNNDECKVLGNMLLIKDGYLHQIGPALHKLKEARPLFYLGYCKHEN